MTDKEKIIQLCLNRDKNGLTFREIGKQFGLSRDAVRGIFRRWKNKQVNFKDDEISNIKSDTFTKLQIERQKLRQEKNEIKKFVRQFATFENIIEQIQEAIYNLPPLPYYKLQNSKINNRELVMLLSDIHIGEISDISPINKYNSEIIKKRLVKYFCKVKEIGNEHKINKINLAILGDLITNYNVFNSQINQIDLDPISQIIQLSEILSYLLNELSKDFIIDIYSCFGNHGKVDVKLRDIVNFERLVVEFLKIRLHNNDSIKFFDSNGIWAIMSIFNYNYLLIHGDKLKDKDNFGYRLKDIMSSVDINICEILTGHLHHNYEKELFASGFGILQNGSISGGNEYSLTRLQVSNPPSQTVFVVDEYEGRTATYRVKLT